ncbi:MAG: type IV pilus twitching motility protein PilT [Aminivibrio sp.]|jgi:twitching motility protein PilT
MTVQINQLLAEVLRLGASDLHLGVGHEPCLRIDGALHPVDGAPVLKEEDLEKAISEILTPEQMGIYKENHEYDFSFTFRSPGGEEARFRGNSYFELGNMTLALRLIPMSIRSIEDLGLPKVLHQITDLRRGLFLVTGPTGHGKTTTLAALIDEINGKRNEHIVTIEDPVEYLYKSKKAIVHQRQVGIDTRNFAEALKRVLRQDPDVILIGEMRDLETVSSAITAAETGHLVFATLHTQDAAQSIDRIIDVFPPHQQQQIRIQLSSVLVGICSQQLIPRSGGGRVVGTEILLANPAVKNCIREGKTNQIKTLIQTGSGIGMHTMEQCLADKVNEGLLTMENAMAYAYDPKDLQRILFSQN